MFGQINNVKFQVNLSLFLIFLTLREIAFLTKILLASWQFKIKVFFILYAVKPKRVCQILCTVDYKFGA